MREVTCDECGELLAYINSETRVVKFIKDIPYKIEGEDISVSSIVFSCPSCREINHIRGKVN